MNTTSVASFSSDSEHQGHNADASLQETCAPKLTVNHGDINKLKRQLHPEW